MILADVTKGITYEILETIVKNERHLNFYCCVVLRKSNSELIFGKFWYNGQLGIETKLLNDSKRIYDMIYKEVGLIDEPMYFLISKPVTGAIQNSCRQVVLYGLTERQLYPLSYKEYLQIQYA